MAGPWEKYGTAETPSGPWQKYGAAPPAPSIGLGDAVANFAKNFWGEMTQTGQGMVDMFSRNPLDTLKGIGASQDAIRLKARDAMKRGDYTEAARHAINYLIPLVGPGLDVRGDQAQSGDISGALGGTTAIGAQMFGPNALESAISAAPRVASAVGTAADATKAAVKAGVKDVAVGTGKTAAGVALAKAGPLGEIADVIAGIPLVKSGLKQVGQGVRAGYSAGKAALTPPPVEPPLGGMGILSPDYFDRLRLPPGPTITPSAPAPPDASFVRAVPAEYPTVESPLVRGAQQAGGFTPEETARAAAILENVEPQAAPAAAAPAQTAETAGQLYAREWTARHPRLDRLGMFELLDRRTKLAQEYFHKEFINLTQVQKSAIDGELEQGMALKPPPPAQPSAPAPVAAPKPAAVPAVETPLQWTRAEIIDRAGALPAVSEIQRRFKMGYGAATDVLREAQGLRPKGEPTVTPRSAPAAPQPAAPQPQTVGGFMREAPPTPGQIYAQSQGYDWAKLSADDRAALEHVAQAQANMAEQQLPVTPPAAQPQSAADFMRGTEPASELETQLADSLAAAKARKQPAPETPPEAPTQKPENIYAKNNRLAKAVRVADAAQEAGLTSFDVYKMKPDDFAAKVGEKSISADTMAMVVDKLRKLEADAARGGAPPTAPTPTGGGPKPAAPKAAASFKVVKDPAEPGLWNVDVKAGNQSIGTMELIEHPNELEVDLSHLTPEYRGQGYGKAMYQEAMKHAQRLGKRYLTSGSEFTEDAARVWRSLGGEQFTDAAGESRWRLPVPK